MVLALFKDNVDTVKFTPIFEYIDQFFLPYVNLLYDIFLVYCCVVKNLISCSVQSKDIEIINSYTNEVILQCVIFCCLLIGERNQSRN